VTTTTTETKTEQCVPLGGSCEESGQPRCCGDAQCVREPKAKPGPKAGPKPTPKPNPSPGPKPGPKPKPEPHWVCKQGKGRKTKPGPH
jgi:hypothetical protein